ncbi:MAG: mechanosensitive ion channel family protein [Candidatus Micrarchaeia archaeon]
MFDQGTLYYIGHIVLLFAISVVVGRIAGPIFTRILEFLSGKTSSTLDDRVIAAIKAPAESFFFLIVFYFLIHSFPELAAAAAFLEGYTYAILVVIATFMLSEASGAAIRWYYEEGAQQSRSRIKVDLSLLPLVRKVTKIAIYIIGLMVALSATGFDITGLLAVTSIAGVILGLASQETLGNVFAGIALQIDRPYHYGDYLRLPSGEIAVIRKIGMRTTRLEDIASNTIIISNSEFAKLRVTNLSLPDSMGIVAVPAELPLYTDFEALRTKIEEKLVSEKPKGFMAEKGVGYWFDAVKPYSAAVSYWFWVDGFSNSFAIKKMIYREIIAFSGNGPAKGKKPAGKKKN